MAIQKIIIVGAGPSGLLLALLLAKQGIEVEVLEQGTELDKQPRAAHYGTCAIYEFDRAGVLDDIRAEGIDFQAVAWRKLDGTFIAGMQLGEKALGKDYQYRMAVLPLDRLLPLLYKHLLRLPHASVRFANKVLSIGQHESKSWVNVQTTASSQLERKEADYVVGCDGATSAVRKGLFGSEYLGETLHAQIVATDVYYDFSRWGYWDSNFIVHPTNWYMAAKISNDNLYRVTYGDVIGLSREEYIQRQPTRFAEIFRGVVKPGDYVLANLSPYQLQQRCAPEFRVGRILLAADAAHLCNPFGGLGLAGGIADIGSLFDAFIGIHKGLADDSILDKYNMIRKNIWKGIIDPMSRENFRRLHDQNPDKALENDEFFKLCTTAENSVELQRQLALGMDAFRHDFTQYYNK